MDYVWVFTNSDGTTDKATLPESSAPVPGDGKLHNERGYRVTDVVGAGLPGQNPKAFATEIDISPPSGN